MGFSVSTQDGTNVVGLVVFSVVLGVIIGRMGDAGRPVRDFVDSLQQAILQIVTLVIWLATSGPRVAHECIMTLFCSTY